MTIYELNGDTAHAVWKDLQPFFEPAMRYHPDMDVIDLYHLVMAGRGQVFAVIDEGEVKGAAVMEILTYPSEMVGNILAIGGKSGFLRRYMEPLADHLIEWSRARGCTKIRFEGRHGWARYVQGKFGAYTAPPTVKMWMPIKEKCRTH